ncbi:hypothetical protein [Rossellomorea aquimaris]|uniref:Uncharacterized protein n=1 Tax=Rossellomorea aquimaris TaxID=189382 RepID=A0A1J6W4T7_9BACI|nr:hypothetical protein [Rossellomorea aquimaris]OIU73174.1 hypothetical protein BHE18_14955 [Rossellomorea aquimaris]
MDNLLNEDEKIVNDYYFFKEKILNNQLNLQRVFDILEELNTKKEGLLPATFYFNEYFPNKFGKEASRFLNNLLDDSGDLIRTLTEIQQIEQDDLAEMSLIAFKYKNILDKVYGIYTESYNLLNVWSASNKKGELLTSFTRVDNETFVVKLEIEDSLSIINHLVNSLIKHYEVERREDIKEEIMIELNNLRKDLEAMNSENNY